MGLDIAHLSIVADFQLIHVKTHGRLGAGLALIGLLHMINHLYHSIFILVVKLRCFPNDIWRKIKFSKFDFFSLF